MFLTKLEGEHVSMCVWVSVAFFYGTITSKVISPSSPALPNVSRCTKKPLYGFSCHPAKKFEKKIIILLEMYSQCPNWAGASLRSSTLVRLPSMLGII